MTELEILLWVLKERFPEKNITLVGQYIDIDQQTTISIVDGLYVVTKINKHKFDDIKAVYQHVKGCLETKDQLSEKTIPKRKTLK